MWLTAGEAADVVGVHERTIRRAIARGDLAATREGGRFRITRDNLHAYQQRQQQGSVAFRRPLRPRRLSPLSSVPAPPTAIIGREREVRQALDLLTGPDGRLLTLTGPGGVGKTRLATAVAIACGPTMPDGAVFVPLEAIREPEHVVTAIAQKMGIAAAEGRAARESLLDAVRHRRQLLILDNFEHLLAAAAVVAELLAAGPGLRVLVTSREALRLRGETEQVVLPLALPDLAAPPRAETIGRAPAVELFVRRARAVRVGFALTDDNAGTVGAICQSLDGLPLAIELAAAQIKHASPATLSTWLERRLETLTNGPRDLPDRLRTMRSAVAWSYNLLSADQQRCFRALSVFAGGFTLEAAAAIDHRLQNRSPAQGDGAVPLIPPTRELLVALVDKSLVRRSENEPGDVTRFDMLETIRAFAREHLVSSGEHHTVLRHHAAYYLSLAETASLDFHGPGEASALTRLESDIGNYRAALAWAAGADGSVEMALRLANGLFWLWYVRGYHLEGWTWFESLLALPDAEHAPVPLTEAMIHAGWLALRMGMSTRATQFFAAALERCHALGLPRSAAFARGSRGFAELVGFGDSVRAAAFLESARLEAQAVGDRWLEAMDDYGLGIAALATGDVGSAQALCERSLAISRDDGDRQGVAANLAILGQLARLRGDVDAAMHSFSEALTHYQHIGDRGNVCTCVESLAGLLVSIGRTEQGVLLFGAAAAFRQRIGTPVQGHEQARYDADVATARAALAEDPFWAAWRAGEGARLSEAISGVASLASVAPAGVDAVSGPPAPVTTLTRRERQILELIGAGNTDRQIGDLLAISPATVTKHVGNALAKLGVHSRAAAAVLLLTASV